MAGVSEQSADGMAERLRVARLEMPEDERNAFDAMLLSMEKRVKDAAQRPDADAQILDLNARLEALPADRSDDGESTWVTVTTTITVTTTSRWLCD